MKYILVFIFTLSSIICFGRNSQENKDKSNNTNSGSKVATQGKSNFTLVGRRVSNMPSIDNNCNQSGRVIIEVTVDKSGQTISAVKAKGTTADACLIELAIKFALQTKWQPSETAPEKQTGLITYNFSF